MGGRSDSCLVIIERKGQTVNSCSSLRLSSLLHTLDAWPGNGQGAAYARVCDVMKREGNTHFAVSGEPHNKAFPRVVESAE